MSRIRLYRPSNGTEGQIFQEQWCDRCRRGQGDGCRILSDSMAFDTSDKEYPSELRYENDMPICTAFRDVNIPIVRSHKPGRDQLPLFEE